VRAVKLKVEIMVSQSLAVAPGPMVSSLSVSATLEPGPGVAVPVPVTVTVMMSVLELHVEPRPRGLKGPQPEAAVTVRCGRWSTQVDSEPARFPRRGPARPRSQYYPPGVLLNAGGGAATGSVLRPKSESFILVSSEHSPFQIAVAFNVAFSAVMDTLASLAARMCW
jgi:hypothetical protein